MNILDRVYTKFHKELFEFGDCYLAGGCVRDHLMGRRAKDYDFFILNNSLFNNYDEISDKIKQKLSKYKTVNTKVEWHNSEPYLVITVKYMTYDVQILFNPARSIDELLDTFDWNTCLFSYGKSNIETCNPYFNNKETIENIGVGKELRLNKITFPLSTLRRGFRFSERFLMKLKKEDIISLSKEILINNEVGLNKGPIGNEPDMTSLSKNTLVN